MAREKQALLKAMDAHERSLAMARRLSFNLILWRLNDGLGALQSHVAQTLGVRCRIFTCIMDTLASSFLTSPSLLLFLLKTI